MTRAYWEFLVHGEKLQAPIPSTKEVQRVARAARPGKTHADSFSVARVRPRTSKGITDLLLLNLVRLEAACPSKKNCLYADSKNRARPTGEPANGGPLGCRNTPI